jgi:hypothetical protein
MQKSISAKGTKGVLMRNKNGGYMLRVYDKDHNFIDYDIYHSDLQIEIIDEDASFYTTRTKNILNHSPKTLGWEE